MDLIVHRICVGCSKYEKQSIIDIDKLKIKFRKTKRRSKFAVIFIKQKPPAMPVEERKTTKALAAANSRYTKKAPLC